MQAFEIEDVLKQRDEAGGVYLEFLRSNSLSVGVAVFEAGSVDTQSPHNEDEVYYVVSGRGHITVDGEPRDVAAGSVVFVGAHVPHHFHDVDEDLEVLVFFAPPESD